MLQSFLDAQEFLQEQQRKLKENSSFFHQHCRSISQIQGTSDFPVFVYSPDDWVDKLQEQGYITSSFSYPSSSSPKVNRIVLSASHSKEEVSALLEILTHLPATL
jgi:7-keto-8-aminopelargonate synthetase-like enzyme